MWHIGKISFSCQYDSKWYAEDFFIADTSGPAILGQPSIRHLRLVTLHYAIEVKHTKTTEDLMKAYPDHFDRIGHFAGKYKIMLDPSVPPVIYAQENVQYTWKIEELRKALDKMINDKIIRKVEDLTDWVSSLAYSRKSNVQLRICLNPKDHEKVPSRHFNPKRNNT